jgi:short-subunit dehydrogenase involved in D-alanine esterification of teichoic acids
MKIENSVILITGGASGIGEDMAKYFSEKGGLVYISDVQIDKGEKIQSESKGKIKFINCDVSNENQVKDLIEKVYKENKRIDVVINNAGISGASEVLEKDISK